MTTSPTLRPNLKPYVLSVLGLSVLWGALVVGLGTTEQATYMSEEEIGYMSSAVRWGVATIMAIAALVFGGHWLGKAILAKCAVATPSQVLVMGAPVSNDISEVEKRRWSLELRGVGIAPGAEYQSRVWDLMQEKRDNFSPFYSQNANDYPELPQSRSDRAKLRIGGAFKSAGRPTVAYWPIPAFAVEPPQDDEKSSERAASLISTGKNKGSLGVTNFLWEADANSNYAQGMVEQLFQFFDKNPEVPEALIASRDGDDVRDLYRKRGTPRLSDDMRLPNRLSNTAALLVARTDRVDRYLRPYAPDYPEDNQNKATDLGKLWAFYWETDRTFDNNYADALLLKGIVDSPPGTLPSAEWHAALPALWQTIDNRGPGLFEPTPWLPVRWAKHQVDEFDRAPKLGHLHRPVKVELRDEQGKPLKAALQVQAMTAGWQQALATLPEGDQPVRVFYDSTDNLDAVIALTNALHQLNIDGHGLDLGNVDEGYDIGRRLWNVGVGSTLLQIGLGAIASYKDGGISAVVYAGENGSVSIQMVRPPSAEEKAHNAAYGADPFMFGL